MTRRARALLLLPALALGGCVGEEREKELGNQVAAHVNAQLPLVEDPALNLYVTLLGRAIARQSARPDLPYRFYIVNSPAVNAFALPGGHIYVNRGLIERTENASELSAVLAHEIGHVAARHGAEMVERQLRTGSVVSILYNLILGHEPEILEQSALRIGGALWNAAHTREAEKEADELAVEYLIEAGVDPEGMVTLLTSLLREEAESPGPLLEWFSTHPTTGERLEATRREIADEMPDDPPALTQNLPSYPRFLRRMRALPPPPPPMPVQ